VRPPSSSVGQIADKSTGLSDLSQGQRDSWPRRNTHFLQIGESKIRQSLPSMAWAITKLSLERPAARLCLVVAA